MAFIKFFATLIIALCCMPALADCKEECEATYQECKTAHDSPNGQKICGSDYHECKTKCSDNEI
jgi:hypothetical protein